MSDYPKIDILNRIHCELIANDVRHAWYIQACDYDFNQTTIDYILDFIRNNYPNLKIQSFKDNFLITKNTSDIDINHMFETLDKNAFQLFLGNILGFTCNNFDMKRSYDLIYYKTTRKSDSCSHSALFEPFNLISFICSCNNSSECDKKVEEFKNKISQCINTIQDNEFKNCENDVIINKKDVITVDYLIDKLITSPTELSDIEKWEITNYLYNLGFDDSFHKIIMNTVFQYDNPIHVGIILTLLSHYKHNYLEPFCPLQSNGDDKMKLVEKITLEWQEHLTNLIIKTIKE